MSLLWALNSQFHFQKGRIFFGGNTKKGFLYIAQSEWNSLCRPDGLEFSEISLSLPLSVGSKGVRPHAWLFKFIHFWRLHQPVSHDWKTFEIKLKGRKLINIFHCFRSVVSWWVSAVALVIVVRAHSMVRSMWGNTALDPMVSVKQRRGQCIILPSNVTPATISFSDQTSHRGVLTASSYWNWLRTKCWTHLRSKPWQRLSLTRLEKRPGHPWRLALVLS